MRFPKGFSHPQFQGSLRSNSVCPEGNLPVAFSLVDLADLYAAMLGQMFFASFF